MVASTRVHQLLRSGVRIARDCFSSAFTSFLPQAPKLWTQSRNCELARNRCQSLLHEPTTLLPDSESRLLLPLSSISNCRQLQHHRPAHNLAEPYPIKGASFSLTSLTT